ncbi:16261_t:CDS:2 [Cetraspora pellucida]|uniref:16261_t:CDS:1 n=1 Tax=Cetraspora pellucida TaxID=1433469 RepID=A0A9N8ZHM2_9GLOM|nr:16261_t:CDS:2 [Cetraspora pellucida]
MKNSKSDIQNIYYDIFRKEWVFEIDKNKICHKKYFSGAHEDKSVFNSTS